MFCPKCGKQLPDYAKFCDGCGIKMPSISENAISEEKKTNDIQNQIHDSSKSEKNAFFRNKFNIFVVAVTAVLAIVLISLICARPKEKAQAKKDININALAALSTDESVDDEKQFLSAQSWEEMSFLLDGVEYQLPLETSELEKHGWKLSFSDEKVEPGKCIDFTANNQLSYIKGTLCNFGENNTDSKNCKIRSIRFAWATGVFPKEIVISSSSIADVFEAYGDADYFDEYSKLYVWGDRTGHLGGKGQYIRFYFDSYDVVSFAEIGCGID